MPDPITRTVIDTVGDVITEVITYCPETDEQGNVHTSSSTYAIGTSTADNNQVITTCTVEDNVTKTVLISCETVTDSMGKQSTITVTECPECNAKTVTETETEHKGKNSVTVTESTIVSNGQVIVTSITETVTVKLEGTNTVASDVTNAKSTVTTVTETHSKNIESTSTTTKQIIESGKTSLSTAVTSKQGPVVEEQVSASANPGHSSAVISQYTGGANSLKSLGNIGALISVIALLFI